MINDLNNISPFLREFGVSATVLFLILLFGLWVVWTFFFRFGKKLDDLDRVLSARHDLFEGIIGKIDTIKAELSSFRDSEHDCVKDLKHKADTLLANLDKMSEDQDTLTKAVQEMSESMTGANERLRDIFSYFIDLLRGGGTK